MNRHIFQYNDGFEDVFADPTELDDTIARLGIEETLYPARIADMPRLEDGDIDFDKADPADVRLLYDTYREAEPLIRQAFRVPQFDRKTGRGLLYAEAIELYSRYMDWQESIKKNINPQPTSHTPTG